MVDTVPGLGVPTWSMKGTGLGQIVVEGCQIMVIKVKIVFNYTRRAVYIGMVITVGIKSDLYVSTLTQ